MMKSFFNIYLRIIAGYSGWVVAAISVLTIVMGYYAGQASFTSSSRDFLPQNEKALALDQINEKFGNDNRKLIAIIETSENVLAQRSLQAMLLIEEMVQRSELGSFTRELHHPSQKVISPAQIVVYALYLDRAIEGLIKDYPEITKSFPPVLRGGAKKDGSLQEELAAHIPGLTTAEKRVVLEGGTLPLHLPSMTAPVSLIFEPYDEAGLAAYLGRASFAQFLSQLLSKDYDRVGNQARYGLIYLEIPCDLSVEQTLACEELFLALARDVELAYPSVKIRILGQELISKLITAASVHSMWYLISIAGIIVVIILTLIYRSFIDVFVNLAGLIMAIIWVFGLGVLLQYTFNPILAAVPILIIGLGIDYGLHLTLRYREEIARGHEIDTALQTTLQSVGFVLVITTVTTVIGFLSNTIAELSAIRHFGILAAAGLLSAFGIMLTFVPAMKIMVDRYREKRQKNILPPLARNKLCLSCLFDRKKRHQQNNEQIPEFECTYGGTCNKIGIGIGVYLAQKPLAVIVTVLILTGVSGYFASELETRFDYRDFLPAQFELTKTYSLFLNEFTFSNKNVYLLVEGAVLAPDVFKSLGALKQNVMKGLMVGEEERYESPLELARKLSNYASPNFNPEFTNFWSTQIDQDFDGIPDETITSNQVEVLYDNLFRYAPDQASRVLRKDATGYTAFLVRVPVLYANEQEARQLTIHMEAAAEILSRQIQSPLARVIVTGDPVVTSSILKSLRVDQVNALLITVIMSLVVLTLLYLRMRKSLLLGLVTILPLLFVIVWGFGTMYLLSIPLNVITVTIASLTVGLGITYSIHITQRFLEDVAQTDDAVCALCISVTHTGQALFGAAVTTAAGFGILSFAIIPPLSQFGIMAAFNIIFAFLAAVYVQPTFLYIWWQHKNIFPMKFKSLSLLNFTKQSKPRQSVA
ncbi:RND family transporter [candidate division CSSED10-310 bacterium]|uniref:RND family transporter n=1 Tax=candidate division CSSED10-310 bacterium TaxID=2855610 RepID=A0ABV6YS42_UNCC1